MSNDGVDHEGVDHLLKRNIKAVLFAIVSLVITVCPGMQDLAAHEPWRSYIYDSWLNPVPVPDSFATHMVLRGQDLGIGPFSNPSDIFYHAPTGEVFLVDTGNSRIVMLNGKMELIKVITELDNNGVTDSFNQPLGVFVNDTGIFVADTQNSRILIIDRDGNVLNEFTRPDTELIPGNITWQPRRLAVDSSGRIYVIAVGVNLGLVELDSQGNFRNFKGANRVSYDLGEYILRRYFSTAEQRARMTQYVPTEYSGLAMDNENFIYVTTNVGLSTGFGADAVRRLNARGDDILRRLGYFDVIGDIYTRDGAGSSLVDIAVDKNGVYSVLDRSNGRIFTYDHDGNLLDIFGGIGFRMGLLQSPVAMDYVEDNIVVIDNFMQNITVYRPTAYGLAVRQATYLYYLGDYEGSAENWQVVLDHNANSDLAYVGLGRVYMHNRDFVRAMEYFRFANAHAYYSTAFGRYRRVLMQENFPIIASVAIVIGILIFVLLKIRARRLGKETEVAYDAN